MKTKDKIKIEKEIKRFEELKKEHEEKIEKERKNYAVVDYWEKQIERFDEEIKRNYNLILSH